MNDRTEDLPDGVCDSTRIDYSGVKVVSALIDQVRAAGLEDAAKMFGTVYWGWLRTMSSYVYGHPYVGKPESGMTPLNALHMTDGTIAHWAPQIPGTPKLDDAEVLREAAADEEWHRQEDRRMRRAAGEPV